MAKKKTLETKNLELNEIELPIEKVVLKLGENIIKITFNPNTKQCETEVI